MHLVIVNISIFFDRLKLMRDNIKKMYEHFIEITKYIKDSRDLLNFLSMCTELHKLKTTNVFVGHELIHSYFNDSKELQKYVRIKSIASTYLMKYMWSFGCDSFEDYTSVETYCRSDITEPYKFNGYSFIHMFEYYSNNGGKIPEHICKGLINKYISLWSDEIIKYKDTLINNPVYREIMLHITNVADAETYLQVYGDNLCIYYVCYVKQHIHDVIIDYFVKCVPDLLLHNVKIPCSNDYAMCLMIRQHEYTGSCYLLKSLRMTYSRSYRELILHTEFKEDTNLMISLLGIMAKHDYVDACKKLISMIGYPKNVAHRRFISRLYKRSRYGSAVHAFFQELRNKK